MTNHLWLLAKYWPRFKIVNIAEKIDPPYVNGWVSFKGS